MTIKPIQIAVDAQKFHLNLFTRSPNMIAMNIRQNTGMTISGVFTKVLAAVMPKTTITSRSVIQTKIINNNLASGLTISPDKSGIDLPLCLTVSINAR